MPRIFPNKEFKSQSEIAKKFPYKVITHAVSNENTFKKIITEKKITLPENRTKKTPLMENILGIQNCSYFSAGFDYNSTFHHWSYSFLFRKTILKRSNFKFFKTYLISQSWMNFLRYLRNNDPKTLQEFKNKNIRTRKEIKIFLERDACSFWNIEKELNDLLEKHPEKKRIINKIRTFEKQKTIKNSYAPKYVGTHYYDSDNVRRMEIISCKNVSLNSKEFIGVYVQKEKLNKIIPFLKKNFSKNIFVFDGKTVKRLNALG